MKKLLNKNPEERLGKNGAKEVKEHKWFSNINWEDLAAKRVRNHLNIRSFKVFLGHSTI